MNTFFFSRCVCLFIYFVGRSVISDRRLKLKWQPKCLMRRDVRDNNAWITTNTLNVPCTCDCFSAYVSQYACEHLLWNSTLKPRRRWLFRHKTNILFCTFFAFGDLNYFLCCIYFRFEKKEILLVEFNRIECEKEQMREEEEKRNYKLNFT